MRIFTLLLESFKFARHALQNNKLRTFLSLLGITIGIFSIILVYAVVDSLEANIRNSINKLGDNIIYIQKWPFGGGGEYKWWQYLNRPEPLPKDAVELEKRSTKAERFVFVFGQDGVAKVGSNSVDGASIIGATYYFQDVWQFNLGSGRYFTPLESSSGKPYCIIGADIAEGLFGNINPVGKSIKAKGRKLTVIGVFEKAGKTLVGQDYDKMVLVPASYLRKMLNPVNNQGNVIMVKAKPGVSVDELSDELRGNLRAIHRLKPRVDDDFSLNEISILSQSISSVFGIIGMAGTVIGGFSILVGGFGIANIMFVSVKERTSEIGIQKALGAKRNFILIQFLFESVMLCLVGGMLGLALLAPTVYVAANAFEFDLFLSTGNIVLGISLSLIIGIVSGALPAIMASRMTPVDAIRAKQ